MKNSTLWRFLNGELSAAESKLWRQKVGSALRAHAGSIVLAAGLGAFVGALLFVVIPRKHTAELMLAIEDEKSTGFENILAQFGIDVAGSQAGGIFQGESLIQLFKTRYLLERTLLTEVTIQGKSEILANRLFPSTRWAHKRKTSGVTFTADRETFTPLQDSVLLLLRDHVEAKILSAEKPDKKQSIIRVRAVHADKHFAKAFVETLVANTSEFYVESLTAKARGNLDVLKREADSVEALLSTHMVRSAVAGDVNVNPLRQTLRVTQNRALVDLQVTVSLYGEIVKNLKLAEISLRKQTPLIQVIDPPRFPLKKTGYELWEWMLLGGILGGAFWGYKSLSSQEF